MSLIVPQLVISPVFNLNNFSSATQPLLNQGTQVLYGNLYTRNNGDIVDGGDLTIYGHSQFAQEPTITSVSDPTTLSDNQLVSKSYVTQAVNAITSPSQYPTNYYYGQYTNNSLAQLTIPAGSSIQILSQDPTSVIMSFRLEVMYSRVFCYQNSYNVSVSETFHSTYDIYFAKMSNFWTTSTYNCLEGPDITLVGGSNPAISFGISQNKCYVTYRWNQSANTNRSTGIWISAYSINLKILDSPTNSTVSTQGQPIYFKI